MALIRIKAADVKTRENLLNEITVQNGPIQLPSSITDEIKHENLCNDSDDAAGSENFGVLIAQDDPDEQDDSESNTNALDNSPFVSTDENGRVSFFGLTSGFHNGSERPQTHCYSAQEVRNQLIANAFIQRQKEYQLQTTVDFDGVPTEMALHLLSLHWNRQHHSFLLTYRPAFTRDLMNGGPYYSRFLLNAIFASGSKFSDRVELRDDPSLPQTAGNRFLRRCQELLYVDSILDQSSISTVVGLLHLGSAYIARGQMSKSWIYTGLAIRMCFDLGLHLDIQSPDLNPEDVEIRRRAFWAAFITDKLQCLYLGRPVAILLRDSHVSTELLDMTEELESWSPYVDPQGFNIPVQRIAIPTFTISAFQQFCLLSELMSRTINQFYFVGARASDPHSNLLALDQDLFSWYNNLPECLVFQPWSSDVSVAAKRVTPNIMVLHGAYHTLAILLHRPFVSNGHLRSNSAPAKSWKACSTAAASITSIIDKWRDLYALFKAPYLLGYSAYVACTIHVRDAALHPGSKSHRMLMSTLSMLDEMSTINPGLSKSVRLIKNLMRVNNVSEVPCKPLLPNLSCLGSVKLIFKTAQSPAISVDSLFDIDVDIDALIRMFPDPLNDQLVDPQMQNLPFDLESTSPSETQNNT